MLRILIGPSNYSCTGFFDIHLKNARTLGFPSKVTHPDINLVQPGLTSVNRRKPLPFRPHSSLLRSLHQHLLLPQIVMPAFTKHCRLCNACMLSLDHHCLFLTRCVAANNHRSFVLFMIEAMFANLLFARAAVSCEYNSWFNV